MAVFKRGFPVEDMSAFMPKLRYSHTLAARVRTRAPRPALATNLAVLALGLAVAGGATLHRQALDRRFAEVVARGASAPLEIKRLKGDLLRMDLTEEEMERQLDARLKYLQTVKKKEFYLSIDTEGGKLYLKNGDNVVRAAPVRIGEAATISGKGGKTWTFAPLKGAFAVTGKAEGASWRIPAWVYAKNRQASPRELPTLANGLGRFVVSLPNGYVIHSSPSPESPLKGAKPGSFLVPEKDLAAIWPRVANGMRVYVF